MPNPKKPPQNNKLIGTQTLPRQHNTLLNLKVFFKNNDTQLTFHLHDQPNPPPAWVRLEKDQLIIQTPNLQRESVFAFTIEAKNANGSCRQKIKLRVTPAFHIDEIHYFQRHAPVRRCRAMPPFFIAHKKRFAFLLKPYFHPQKGVVFSREGNDLPAWLNISKNGRLFGGVPTLPQDEIIRFAVRAENEYGSARQECLLIVSTMEPFDLEQAMETHKKTVAGLSGILTGSRDLLEYIYEYIKQYEAEQFQAMLEQRARELGVDTKKHLTYEDFRAIMLAVSPNIDQDLQAILSDRSKNLLEPISQEDFRNAVRQGSQPTGSIAIPVWNYLGAPDPVNISDIFSSVLESSGDNIINMRRENKAHRSELRAEEAEERRKHVHGPSPFPKRPGGP